jgi:TonB family protein
MHVARMRLLFFLGVTAAAAAGSLPATADDNRSGEAIAAVVARHTPELSAVYDTYLDAGLSFQGTVTVRFTIAPSGVVTASEIAESTTGCKLFDEAVAAALCDWDFGGNARKPVTVRYPFTFRLPEAGTALHDP